MKSPIASIRFICSLIALMAFVRISGAAEPIKVRITGDRVNLRAAPTNTSEVVGQAATGDELVCLGQLGEWMQVSTPDTVDLWVYGEFVIDGKVVVSKLQVRSGPGISYKVLCTLEKGSKVIPRGAQGDWQKIAPPSGTAVWVSSDFAELLDATKKDQDVVSVKKPEPSEKAVKAVADPVRDKNISQVAKVNEPTAGKPDMLGRKPPMPVDKTAFNISKPLPIEVATRTPSLYKDVQYKGEIPPVIDESKLLNNVAQGEVAEHSGVLKRSGVVWRRPSKFRLVEYDNWDRTVTICYVTGDEEQMVRMEDEKVLVSGRKYWIQGVRYPVLVPNRIVSSK